MKLLYNMGYHLKENNPFSDWTVNKILSAILYVRMVNTDDVIKSILRYTLMIKLIAYVLMNPMKT